MYRKLTNKKWHRLPTYEEALEAHGKLNKNGQNSDKDQSFQDYSYFETIQNKNLKEELSNSFKRKKYEEYYNQEIVKISENNSAKDKNNIKDTIYDNNFSNSYSNSSSNSSALSDNSSKLYPYTINEIINKKYKLREHIANGTFGSVFKCENINTHEFFAIKILCPYNYKFDLAEIEANLGKKVMRADKKNESHCVKLLDAFKFKKKGMVYYAMIIYYVTNTKDGKTNFWRSSFSS